MVWVFKRTAEAQRTQKKERREPVVEFKRLLQLFSLDRGRKGLGLHDRVEL